jgi:AraC-like DNA-binding protein
LAVLVPIQQIIFFWLPCFISLISIYTVYEALYNFVAINNNNFVNTVVATETQVGLKLADNNNSFDDLKNLLVKADNRKLKIAEADLNRYSNDITNYLTNRKPYLQSDFDLSELSKGLEIPLYIVSYTINVKFGINFFDLINSYRITEAKTLLQNFDKAKRTIESVGYDVGFNTKSAFYRAFKKHGNCTPSEYLNKLLN